jgi:hypothetical protein
MQKKECQNACDILTFDKVFSAYNYFSSLGGAWKS